MGFKPFRNPLTPNDTPMVQAVGFDYICTGCGGTLPGGAWLYPKLSKDMVVGITAKAGGPDAPVVHQCGKAD
jgi:hypothetical protein